MVKINEFHDMDIPKEIYPAPDYDVKEDLKIYIRNDPMFYRKSFFPAFEDYKKTKKPKCLYDMVNNGLKNYCSKFELPFAPNELLNKTDITVLVSELIQDELQEVNEGVMDFVQNVGNKIMHGGKDPFKDYMDFAKKRLNYKTDKQLLNDMRKKFPKAAPADLARAISQARKAAV